MVSDRPLHVRGEPDTQKVEITKVAVIHSAAISLDPFTAGSSQVCMPWVNLQAPSPVVHSHADSTFALHVDVHLSTLKLVLEACVCISV